VVPAGPRPSAFPLLFPSPASCTESSLTLFLFLGLFPPPPQDHHVPPFFCFLSPGGLAVTGRKRPPIFLSFPFFNRFRDRRVFFFSPPVAPSKEEGRPVHLFFSFLDENARCFMSFLPFLFFSRGTGRRSGPGSFPRRPPGACCPSPPLFFFSCGHRETWKNASVPFPPPPFFPFTHSARHLAPSFPGFTAEALPSFPFLLSTRPHGTLLPGRGTSSSLFFPPFFARKREGSPGSAPLQAGFFPLRGDGEKRSYQGGRSYLSPPFPPPPGPKKVTSHPPFSLVLQGPPSPLPGPRNVGRVNHVLFHWWPARPFPPPSRRQRQDPLLLSFESRRSRSFSFLPFFFLPVARCRRGFPRFLAAGFLFSSFFLFFSSPGRRSVPASTFS